MKIDLTNIPPEGKRFDFTIPVEWWKSDSDEDRIVGLEKPMTASLAIYPAGRKVIVKGLISVRLLLRCDRCLEPYGWDFTEEFRILFSMIPFSGVGEVELLKGDLNLDFTESNLLDSDRVFKEQIILHVPMKSLCTPECKGLCPLCGCNLNTSTCSCSARDNTFLFRNR
jgi:uncharacterized protein